MGTVYSLHLPLLDTGCYFKGDSTGTGVPASMSRSYPTQFNQFFYYSQYLLLGRRPRALSAIMLAISCSAEFRRGHVWFAIQAKPEDLINCPADFKGVQLEQLPDVIKSISVFLVRLGSALAYQ